MSLYLGHHPMKLIREECLGIDRLSQARCTYLFLLPENELFNTLVIEMSALSGN